MSSQQDTCAKHKPCQHMTLPAALGRQNQLKRLILLKLSKATDLVQNGLAVTLYLASEYIRNHTIFICKQTDIVSDLCPKRSKTKSMLMTKK